MTPRETLESGLSRLGAVPKNGTQAVDKLLRFSQLLLEKNKVMNLTAVTTPEEVVTRHFLDCAALVPYIGAGQTVLDIGTGAGFPGMPLAMLTEGQFTLLDALRKRVAFLNDCIAALPLANATAVHDRAEDFAKGHRAAFDLATSRAVAELNVLCELALPQLKIGGAFLVMKAVDCDAELAAAQHAIETLGGGEVEIQEYAVPCTDLTRRLIIVRKIAETPEKYPRRFAKMQSKPL